jgi:hypothetical protein
MSSEIPIVVFAYNRLDPLRETLKALEKADGFPGGPVIIYSDGPKPDVETDIRAVESLRHWLYQWAKDRRYVSIVASKHNRGLRPSITEGVTEQLDHFESLIVLEDDIIVSPVFLKYMHLSLAKLSMNERVCQVSGYFIPHHNKLSETGFLSVPACWGWGTWARAWELYNDNAEELLRNIPGTRADAFNIENSYGYFEALAANAKGLQNTWAVRWYASVFPHNLLTLYPSKSLTRNIGFQYAGTNCNGGVMEKIFTHQHISSRLPDLLNIELSPEESPSFRTALADFYRWQSQQWSKPTVNQIWLARWRKIRSLLKFR